MHFPGVVTNHASPVLFLGPGYECSHLRRNFRKGVRRLVRLII